MAKPASPRLSELFVVEHSGIHGKGLFARRRIRKGELLGTYRGPECRDLERGGPHVLWVESEEGGWIGRDGRNILRYLNHHESPSAEFVGFELYALEDIEPRCEVTIHYGEEFVAALEEGGV